MSGSRRSAGWSSGPPSVPQRGTERRCRVGEAEERRRNGIDYRLGDVCEAGQSSAGPCAIAHICNDAGGWGRGFVLSLSAHWPEPEQAYRRWAAQEMLALGMVQPVRVDDGLWVVNMVAQHGYAGPGNPVPLRYDALESCLTKLAAWAVAHRCEVHMPRIGCGLAGGRWERVEALVMDTLVESGVAVAVYDPGDLEQKRGLR